MADEPEVTLHVSPPPKVKNIVPRIMGGTGAEPPKLAKKKGAIENIKPFQYQKGVGGPGTGRSKTMNEIRRIMQDQSPRCVELLMEAAEKGNIDAAKYIIDQGIGKAKDRIEVEAPHLQELAGVASAALLARVKEIQAKMVDALPIANLEVVNEGKKED